MRKVLWLCDNCRCDLEDLCNVPFLVSREIIVDTGRWFVTATIRTFREPDNRIPDQIDLCTSCGLKLLGWKEDK